jgi:hypothetical protein
MTRSMPPCWMMTNVTREEQSMYQPYPSGAQMPEPQRPAPPPPVQMAVKLMYAGAALSAIDLIVGLVTIGSLKSAIKKADPTFTSSQVHTAEVGLVAFTVIIGLIGIGLWIWMALANNSGKSWARIIGTVLFGLNTLFVVLSLVRPHASLGLVFGLVVWLAGLGAVILLWRPESSQYFTAVSGSRAQPG